MKKSGGMNPVVKVLLIILAIWVGLHLLGFLVKTLFWVGLIVGAIYLFSAVFGPKNRTKKRDHFAERRAA